MTKMTKGKTSGKLILFFKLLTLDLSAKVGHIGVISIYYNIVFLETTWSIEVIKRANIRNRYNQAPHLTQDTFI